MAFVLSVIGIVFLVGGAYLLVEGASRIATAFGISELLIGLTIVAIGTSTPELGVTLVSSIRESSGAITGGSEIIVGNVVGSNIANIGLILGISAIAAAFVVPQEVIRRDFVWLLGASVATGIFAIDGKFVFYEGMILMIGMLIFSWYQYRLGLEQTQKHAEEQRASGVEQSNVMRVLLLSGGLFVLGVGALAVGSDLLVDGATDIALDVGVSEYIIGLTLVAVGTSLPELATSVIGGMKGEGDLVVGNIIGSNICNLLLILAAGMMINTVTIPRQVLTVQIPLMLGLTFAMYPMIRAGRRVHRMEGSILLGAYTLITVLAFVVNR